MFYTKFLVRCCEEERDNKLLLEEIRGRYERWYKTVGVVDNDFREALDWEINNSIIANLIQKDPYGPCDYILGYRLREFNDADELKEGEHLFETPSYKIEEHIDIKPESWEEYYERICRDYDEIQTKKIDDTAPIYNSMIKPKTLFTQVSSVKDMDIKGYSRITDVINTKDMNELLASFHIDKKVINEIEKPHTSKANIDAVSDEYASSCDISETEDDAISDYE
jgi:hypothetical protein